MRVPLKDRAYHYLLNEILEGHFPTNTPITENECCEKLNMSRTPIREALKQLEAEGLVYKITDCGVFVKEITLTDIEEICELRKMFELEALKYAINQITAEEIAECRELLCELNADSEPQFFFRADKSFHKLLLKYCPNRRLLAFYHNLDNQIERFQRLLAKRKDNYKYVQIQHNELLDVLETRDLAACSDALSVHLDMVYDSIVDVYNSQRNQQVTL